MRTLQLVWFGVLCVNAQHNHFGNYSPATWLPGYLQVPCPHCENHMIQICPVGVGLISNSVCAVYMWMDLYSLAVKYMFLCSQLDAWKCVFFLDVSFSVRCLTYLDKPGLQPVCPRCSTSLQMPWSSVAAWGIHIHMHGRNAKWHQIELLRAFSAAR